MTYKVEGLDKLLRQLKELGPEIIEAAEAGLSEVAGDAKTEMQQRVRVDTGRLRDSIRVRGEGMDLNVGPGDEEKDKALANEFGTRHMPAQPYVLPAAEQARKEMPKVIGEHVRKVLPK